MGAAWVRVGWADRARLAERSRCRTSAASWSETIRLFNNSPRSLPWAVGSRTATPRWRPDSARRLHSAVWPPRPDRCFAASVQPWRVRRRQRQARRA